MRPLLYFLLTIRDSSISIVRPSPPIFCCINLFQHATDDVAAEATPIDDSMARKVEIKLYDVRRIPTAPKVDEQHLLRQWLL